MSLVGASLAVVALACLVLAFGRPSAVRSNLALIGPRTFTRRWRPLAKRDLEQAGVAIDPERVVLIKVMCALFAAAIALPITVALPMGAIGPIAGAYLGFIGPSLAIERRARMRRLAADQRVAAFIDWLEALVTSGRPAETALAVLATRPSGATVLDKALGEAASAYALGAPLYRALEGAATRQDLPSLAALAMALERSRVLGRGTVALVRELRDGLRAQERSRLLDAASRVEGTLMLILVLCYLPALMLLVVVPLFMSLLGGLALTGP